MVQLILFLLHLFQPSPPIIVGRDTTYITEPLTADGLPDYEAYLRDLGRKDVTPDNNAAVLVWQASGRTILSVNTSNRCVPSSV